MGAEGIVRGKSAEFSYHLSVQMYLTFLGFIHQETLGMLFCGVFYSFFLLHWHFKLNHWPCVMLQLSALYFSPNFGDKVKSFILPITWLTSESINPNP